MVWQNGIPERKTGHAGRAASELAGPPAAVSRAPGPGTARHTNCMSANREVPALVTIHVSVDPSHVPSHVAETVIHEYMHHVLNALGVRQPMWLHEGLAILAADERWFNDWRLQLKPWIRQDHLPFDALVTASPHTADETFAMAAYYQSYLMVQLVSHRRGEDFFRTLLRYITDGTVTPQGAFIQGVGLPASHLEAAWAEFVNTGTQRN